MSYGVFRRRFQPRPRWPWIPSITSTTGGGLIPNVGEEYMLKVVTNTIQNEAVVARLYKNNVTPASTMTLADYTAATFTGHAAVTLSSATWTVTPGGPTEAQYDSGVPFVSSATTSEDVYGYYLTSAATSVLLWSERFSYAPRRITWIGDALRPRPRVTLSTT